MINFYDGKTELLMHKKDTDETLMIAHTWRYMGATPFEDTTEDSAAEVDGKKGEDDAE